jgi:hypothetical protein
MGVINTCKRSGAALDLSDIAKNICHATGISEPDISQFEQLRDLLACIPGPSCFDQRSFARLSTSDGDIDIRVPRFSISEDTNWIPVLEVLAKADPMVESSANPELFFEQFLALYNGYVALQGEGESRGFPAHIFCRSMEHCLDCYACEYLKNSFECVYCSHSEKLFFSRNSHGCKESYFLDSCEDCSHCLFCFGLVDASYHIFNTEVSRSEYERVLEEVALFSPVRLESARERFAGFLDTHPLPAFSRRDSERCTGNYVFNSTSVDPGFFVYGSSSSANIFCSFGGEGHFNTALTGLNVSACTFGMLLASGVRDSFMTYGCKGNLQYCEYCIACEDSEYLFGCIGLKNKKYCILNREYSKEEYFILRERLITYLKDNGEWGNIDLFRCNILPYNGSFADIYMPLGRIQAHLFGHFWSEDGVDFVSKNESEDHHEFRICDITGQRFTLSEYENDFSSEFGVAIPQRAQGQRFRERLESSKLAMPGKRVCSYTGSSVRSWHGGKRKVLSDEEFARYMSSRT